VADPDPVDRPAVRFNRLLQIGQSEPLQSKPEREHDFDDTAQALDEQDVATGKDRQMKSDIGVVELGRVRHRKGHVLAGGLYRIYILPGRATLRMRTSLPCSCWTKWA